MQRIQCVVCDRCGVESAATSFHAYRYRVDPARATLLTKAEALMASNQGLSFAEAVRQAEKPL